MAPYWLRIHFLTDPLKTCDKISPSCVASPRPQTKMDERLPKEVGVTGVSGAPYGLQVQWGTNKNFGKPTKLRSQIINEP